MSVANGIQQSQTEEEKSRIECRHDTMGVLAKLLQCGVLNQFSLQRLGACILGCSCFGVGLDTGLKGGY